MTYLLTEFAIYLAGAAIIGFVTAWAMQSLRLRNCRVAGEREALNHRGVVAKLSAQIREMQDHLNQQSSEGSETVGRVASEIERMRPLLESLSNGMEQSARDMGSDRSSRERAEQATRELEEIQQKFQMLVSENKKLRDNFDRVTEKISGYEQQRYAILDRTSDVQTAANPEPKPELEPDTKEEAEVPEAEIAPEKPVMKSAFEGFPELERSTSPTFGASKPVEKVGAPQVLEAPPIAGPEDASGASEGATRPLAMIPDLSEDVLDRLELLGLKTNFDLLDKCDSRSGISALSKSMGLGTEVIARWVAIADLLRLEGVRKDDFPRLLAAGVSSVDDLATSSANALAARLTELATDEPAPAEGTVAKWIHEAAGLITVTRR